MCPRINFASLTSSDEDAAANLPKGLYHLCQDLKVPLISQFGKQGVSKAQFETVIPKMAKDALASGSPGNNPIIPSAEQIESLYRDVFSGKRFD